MKNIIKLEETAMFGIAVYALYILHAEWWCYPLMIFGPDIGLIGYAVSNTVGAGLYNLFHHKGLAIVIFAIGIYIGIPMLEITGAILFGHSSMDRMFGYGLKFNRGFKYTHMGVIGGKGK
jgi:hypothetical protein